MKRHSGRKIVGIALILLLTACGSKGDAPGTQADGLPEQTDGPRLEETDWEVVSADAEVLDLSGGMDNPNFEYIFQHTDTVPLDQLTAFVLEADALGEGANDEIYHRFLEAPNKVLAYLTSLGDQVTELSGWDPAPTAELICKFIAITDAVMYGGTEEFAQTVSACREAYPEGRTAELLDVLERERTMALGFV